MVRLLEQWKTDNSNSDATGWARLGMSEVLDALIERNQEATPKGILAIESSFPNEAIILASKLPADRATPLLMSWYEKRHGNGQLEHPRIAAMMLSKSPPQGFAASVLGESQEQLSVEVTLPGHGYGFGGTANACGDSGGDAPREGWPPLSLYFLEENVSRKGSFPLIGAGGDQITYNRVSLGGGYGSCFIPQPLTAETRFHLLAEMLGIGPVEMPWKVQQQTNIIWKNDKQYVSELREAISQEEAKLRVTAKGLHAKGLLTAAEADSVRPRLLVSVSDQRGMAAGSLPQLKVGDSRTSFTFVPTQGSPPQVR
jgi:hypothetical protein